MSTLKTEEVLSRSALVHRLLGWCREAKEKMKEIFTPLFINLPVKGGGNGCKYNNQNINN